MKGPTDSIEIADLEVSCIVGVYPSERGTAQPLLVDLELEVDTRAAAVNEDLAATVDYGRLASDVRFLLERCRFSLLETAAEVLARYLLLPPLHGARTLVTSAGVRLRKPRALVGHAVAGVRIQRAASELQLHVEPRTYGSAERLFLGREWAVERRRVGRGQSTGAYTHADGEAHELMLTDGFIANGAPAPAGAAYTYRAREARRYDAEGEGEHAVLCIRRPAVLDDVPAQASELVAARAALFVAPGSLATGKPARLKPPHRG